MKEMISTGSFIILVCSTVTSLVVEAIKRMVGADKIKNTNILVAIVSVLVGVIIPVGHMIIHKIPMTPEAVLYVAGTVGLSWLCAMVGYDKVIQTLLQMKR